MNSRTHLGFVRALFGPIAVIAFALTSVPAHAQNGATQTGTPAAKSADPNTKRALTIDDYSRWRTINAATMSGDGKWVAYGLSFTNTPTAESKPVLHIVNLDNNSDVTVPDGSNPTFSPDSKWVTYFVDPAAPRGGRGGRGGGGGAPPAVAPDSGTRGRGNAAPPPPRRVELRELATGKITPWQDIATATFSPTSTHLLLRRRPASGAAAPAGGRGGAPGGGGGGGGRGGAPGGGPVTPPSDVILHDLINNRGLFLGSVGDATFTRKGDFFAYTIDATVRDGNGLFVMDLKANTTRALDNDAKNYSRMTFNDDGSAIAVLKGSDVPKMREHDNALIVFPNLRAAYDAPNATPLTFDAAASLPKGFVVSDRAPLTWSDDNKRVFFGMMPQTAAPDTARRANEDSVADVDVWSYADERVQSLQMARADADRNFTFREAFDVSTSKMVKLSDSTMKDLEVSSDGRWAVGRDSRGMISDYERPRADIYRVNTTTGERTLMLKGALIGQQVVGISPNNKEYVYWKDDKFQEIDLETGATKTIGAGAPSFVDVEFDHPGPKPPYPVAGFTKDGTGIIVESRYDLWVLPFDGSAAKNITEGLGTKQEIKFAPVRLETPDPMASRADREARVYDLTKPITLSAYGEWTKKAGFYQLSSGKLIELLYDDASYSVPQKAAHADRFLLTRQTFAEFPDLRVSSPDFKTAKKITDVNPQQAEFLWGHRVLFDYKLKDGRRAQGILAVPDDYKQGEKRPMMVTFYEKNSQTMHRYSAPSYITGMGAVPMEATTKGYLVMLPDVYFHTGSSHSDMLDAVESATKKIIEMGYADPKHISLNGHSYGGEGAGFIATRSRLFAAVGVGAGVSDLFSDFAQSWGWSYQNQTGASGQNGLDYYLYGQGRWGFSPWDKPDVYHFESSLSHVPEVTQPILIMHGTADPTVSFQEGLKFYTALRYNKKEAYLLAYLNQPHGLRGLADRRDLTIRYFQFFDHFLKGTPAPKWMTDGVPYLVKEAGGAKDPK